MTCHCDHPVTVHVRFTGSCGLCDCPYFRERPTGTTPTYIAAVLREPPDAVRDRIAARVNALIQQVEPHQTGPLTLSALTWEPPTDPRRPWDSTAHPITHHDPITPRKRKRRGWFGCLLARAHTRGGGRRQDDK